MIEIGFLKKENLQAFLKELAAKYTVYAPFAEEDIVSFKPLAEGRDICLDRPANLSPKSVIFPQYETLFKYSFLKKEDSPDKVDIKLEEQMDFKDTVIFGARPCDAKGFTVYDRVYKDSDIPDPYYTGRREKTVIIGLACPAPSPGCFCVSVGGGPADKEGSDILITELPSGYVFEPVTEKGKALMQSSLIEDGKASLQEAQKKQEETKNKVKNPFTKTGKPEISQKIFNEDEFWEQALSKCVSCAACTFLCPTCYCFNITDESRLKEGERIRSWDACMFFHFTLEASGHNPRPTKFHRFKNRVGHKFVYYPEKYNGVIACCGCGRCIRYCPVSVDISKVVDDLCEQSAETNLTSNGGKA
ncbi:MAG TPA: 4Fe-4S dicluster domain-containing protein [Syntrophorhabdaceae bacterium]|nr:4Fe-4S dicluster domain-containing protein [Syntrophorhabdaceae bacterium]HOL05617.1 4Fe-4S dicluster domain-containing protein [Syntrophorhabdaceae bacterium]HON84983.1 4Fe-4S dicluster domain-containing protein [Syntrophorhabdaceae bacterium]HPC66630.1 4Fe-4S dicluster domain-containing protein [Syntrophorhabdaceae bacterium]HPP42150.1 4Fe-4S dicluster domain-containing protein [Syntrophorhabdaceae bacterium]